MLSNVETLFWIFRFFQNILNKYQNTVHKHLKSIQLFILAKKNNNW